MKPIRLTQKEISRADREIPDRPFTIIVRQQEDGRYWVAAIGLNTRLPLFEKLGQQFVDTKRDIPDAIREVGRDLHKFTGYDTDMTDKMRIQHMEGKPLGSKNPKKFFASDRSTLIRFANQLSKGSPERRVILAGLKSSAVIMEGITNRKAKVATLLLTVTLDGDGSLMITARADQVLAELRKDFDKGHIQHRAQKLKQLTNLIRGLQFPQHYGEPSVARIGTWSKQESWSDDSGFVVVSKDRLLGEAIADFLPQVFPISGGGVAGSTGYHGNGWLKRGPTEWVWEDYSFGIGD